MRKVICLLLLSMVLLLTACTEQAGMDLLEKSGDVTANRDTNVLDGTNPSNITSEVSQNRDDSFPGILVKTPMTLSDNQILYKGNNAHLRLKMVRGKYYEDWNPGAIMGTIWEGSFTFELSDESEKRIASTDLAKYYTNSDQLIFTSKFQLEFDDYNNDGDMDFTLGQYATSNGRVYKLFTLKPDGTVEELPIRNKSEFFISNSSGYYSTKLQKNGDTSFSFRYYDNSQGKTYESTYEWQDEAFVRSDTKEILP